MFRNVWSTTPNGESHSPSAGVQQMMCRRSMSRSKLT